MDFKLKTEVPEKNFVFYDLVLLAAVTNRFVQEINMNKYISEIKKVPKIYRDLIYDHLAIFYNMSKNNNLGFSLPVYDFNRTVPAYYFLVPEFYKIYYVSSEIDAMENHDNFRPKNFVNLPVLSEEDQKKTRLEYANEIYEILNRKYLLEFFNIKNPESPKTKLFVYEEGKLPWHNFVFFENFYHWVHSSIPNAEPLLQRSLIKELRDFSSPDEFSKIDQKNYPFGKLDKIDFESEEASNETSSKQVKEKGENTELVAYEFEKDINASDAELRKIIEKILKGSKQWVNDRRIPREEILKEYFHNTGNNLEKGKTGELKHTMKIISKLIFIFSSYALRSSKTQFEKDMNPVYKSATVPGGYDEARKYFELEIRSESSLNNLVSRIMGADKKLLF